MNTPLNNPLTEMERGVMREVLKRLEGGDEDARIAGLASFGRATMDTTVKVMTPRLFLFGALCGFIGAALLGVVFTWL